MKTIELITPAFNEQDCVSLFYEEVTRVFRDELPEYRCRITYVDDGSTDKTLMNILKLVEEHPESDINYISFSRNFGKEAAMYAGLSQSKGDYVAVLDIDLQHPPVLLREMVNAIETLDYDCATARRVNRKGEPVFRSFISSKFYGIFNHITGLNLLPGATDYRLMKRTVVDAIVAMSETERFTKGIYSWIGFNNKWIEYENVERSIGKTKWSMRGLMRYSMHGFMAFATAPLRLAVWLGLVIVGADVIWMLKILIEYLLFGTATGGGMTTLTLIVLFLGGVIISILGVIGEYMARIYLETKKRPVYITRKTNINDCKKES